MTARTLPLPGEFDNMSPPVIIRGQRGGNSSSVVDTFSIRSATPLFRSAAYLLLFIHLARLGHAHLRVGTSVALLSCVERQKSLHSEQMASLGIINKIFNFEPCFEGSTEFDSYPTLDLRPEE
jgi:hypothetical protein